MGATILLHASNFSCGVNSLETESDEEGLPEGERRPVPRVCHDISAPSSSTPDVRGGKFTSSTEEDLPPLPPSFEDTPPKPPDRPPKKVNLRSLFHPSSEEPAVENAQSPSRPYFFRKPPAPDPPVTPPESSPVLSACSDISRSSTPDLPPPPPPPPAISEETVVCDEPLPPPPQPETQSEVVPTSSCSAANDKGVEAPLVAHHHTSPPPKPPYKETYHKDSYMAHRKDWKTGYEGRYRRTHSPCAPDRNGVHSTARENLINLNNNNNNNNIKSSQSKPGTHATTYHTSANLRSALSTSSLVQRPASPVDNVSFLSENSFNNGTITRSSKGWSPHMRQKSTTVNFTSEELRAFKARRAAQESMLSSTGDLNCAGSSPSPLRPLTRAFSMGEPFHVQSAEENGDSTSDDANDEPLTLGSGSLTPEHDGPITAHPAQVKEEATSTCAFPSLPTTSLSKDFTQSSVLTTSQSFLSLPTSPVALSITSSTSSLASASSSSSSSTLVSSKNAPIVTSSAAVAPSCAKTQCDKIDYRKALSSIGTCPSMTLPTLSPDEASQRANIVVLKYGRAPKAETVVCDKLSLEFAQMGNVDSRLQALLAPRPPYRSMASYMDGIFALEMRKDLLCQSHANHPDFNAITSLGFEDEGRENLCEEATRTCLTTVAGDSLCFTSSESKVWSTASETPVVDNIDKFSRNSQVLREKKEELTNSINRNLDVLREEQRVVREEISQNSELGLRVTEEVELRAKPSEADKVKLHIEEIDKITSLLLGLSGRLARVENSLILLKDEDNIEQKRILEGKKEKLTDQLEEAKKLKENIDRRAVQVSKILTKYLTEEEYAEYDHFVKMKAKLIMDGREIDEKIKLGEEQLHALQDLMLPL